MAATKTIVTDTKTPALSKEARLFDGEGAVRGFVNKTLPARFCYGIPLVVAVRNLDIYLRFSLFGASIDEMRQCGLEESEEAWEAQP
jgi:hypothetical protein